ncbi:serine/threonine-protein kinase [Nocardia sp. NPDC050406]|uniref:serine/threonine-protein kinase n=1 Tax=Nocardia sp. NPDC050406 TaxID=3364318 RepID=UPI0037BB0B92
MPLRPGTIVGGYRVVETLGSGGMGSVYLVRNPVLPRRDALKVLRTDLSSNPEYRARFEREANLSAALDHPNIVKVYSRGETDGQLWISMQYVPGTDAAEEAARGPSVMTPPRALHIIGEIGKGLDYAHRHGLLHRDVKPANFLLSHDGDVERVLLTDFGVAKSTSDAQELTATGNFLATMAYAAPEQLLGERLDHRVDIYSLGCSFVKLLTGDLPFPETTPALMTMSHLYKAPPAVSARRPDLPPALDRVIAKAMAKDPDDRYDNCREFVLDAETALRGGEPEQVAARPVRNRRVPGDDSRPDRPRSRRRGVVFGAAAVLLVLAAVAAFLVGPDVFGRDRAPAEEIARVRAEHPEFSGKTVAAFDFRDSALAVYLDPTDQVKFLQDIGFRYSTEYRSSAGEQSPRPLSDSFALPSGLDVIVIVRSDKQAGNGGLRGLPSIFTSRLASDAKLVVLDAQPAVGAFRDWSEDSAHTLIADLVPAIAKVL